MGCGTSKEQQQKLQLYERKLEELMTINGQLAASIAELKDIKMKRKPIYVLHDQEMEDLVIYKQQLEIKFRVIETEIARITKQLQIQVKPELKKKRRSNKPIDLDQIQDEELWRKNMMEDNDITIKPFENLDLDVLSNKSNQNSQKNNSIGDMLIIGSQKNLQKQIDEAQRNQPGSQKIVLQAPEQKQKENEKPSDINEIKININGMLGSEFKEYNNQLQNKLFQEEQEYIINQQQVLGESQIQIRLTEQSNKEIVVSPDNNTKKQSQYKNPQSNSSNLFDKLQKLPEKEQEPLEQQI